MISFKELYHRYYQPARGIYCGGVKSEYAQGYFVENLMNYLDQISPVFFNLYIDERQGWLYTGETSGDIFTTSGTLRNGIYTALSQDRSVILKLYEGSTLKNTCKVLEYQRSDSLNYLLVLEQGLPPRDFPSPYLAIYELPANDSTAIKKIASSSMGLVTDITDIFNTSSDSADWGTSEMIRKFQNLLSAVKSNHFFSVQDEDTLQPYPVKIFLKTVPGELADETQYDFYKLIDFSKWEHLRIISSHSSASTIGSYKVLLRETKETAKADVLETITETTEITVSCESGRTWQGNNIMTLAIGCSASDNSTAAEERIVFSTGSSVESITVTGVSWANGDTPSFKANKVYEINITYVPILGKFLAAYAEY